MRPSPLSWRFHHDGALIAPPGRCRVKAERNFIAELDAAVASYDSHPQQLRLLTRSLRHPDTRKPCRRSAKELLKREPESLEAIASLIFCYSSGTSAKNLRTAIDLAHQSAQGDPDVLKTLLGKVRQSLDAAGRSHLNTLLARYDAEADQIAQRQHINLEAQERRLRRPQVNAQSCDVITVTSNEGPYIAEFIHHYPFQGFSHLFIGINNDTTGHTGRIVAATSQHYPQCESDQHRSGASTSAATGVLLPALRHGLTNQQLIPLHGGGCE